MARDVESLREHLSGGDRRRQRLWGIRRLLAEQVEHSSAPEQQVLAVEHEPVNLAGELDSLGSRLGRGAVLGAFEALRRRSLIDRAETPGPPAFSLQAVVPSPPDTVRAAPSA